MNKLELPTRTDKVFIEHRGEFVDGQVEDRPYRILKDHFIEYKGLYEDVKELLSDTDILFAGGLDVFFKDGERVAGNWPWTGEDKRKPVEKVAAKPAKKKAKK